MPMDLNQLLTLVRTGHHADALPALIRFRATLAASHPLRPGIDFNIALCQRQLGVQPATQAQPHRRRAVHVGLIAPNDRTKGLYRDIETVVWALEGCADVSTTVLEVATNLSATRYGEQLQQPFTTSEGPQQLGDWLDSVSLVMAFEVLNPTLVDVLKARGKPLVYVPNLEWASLDPRSEDTRSWEQLLQREAGVVTTIARTASIEALLRHRRVPTVRVDWSIPDPVVDRPVRQRSPGDAINILFNAGNFGFKERRGLDVVLASLQHLPPPARPLHFLFKGNKSRDELDQLPAIAGVSYRVDNQFVPDRDALLRYYDDADVVLYPSRFEGLGLSLLEALHRGCYVLATDGEPMSELLPAEFPRVAATVAGRLRHAFVYEPSPRSLAALIAELASRDDAVLPVNAELYRERQRRFREQLRALCRVLG